MAREALSEVQEPDRRVLRLQGAGTPQSGHCLRDPEEEQEKEKATDHCGIKAPHR